MAIWRIQPYAWNKLQRAYLISMLEDFVYVADVESLLRGVLREVFLLRGLFDSNHRMDFVSLNSQNKQCLLQILNFSLNQFKMRINPSESEYIPTKFSLNKPYIDSQDFLTNYKPHSRYFDMKKLKKSQQLQTIIQQDGYYYGEVKQKVKNGLGVHFHINSQIYEGAWNNNQKNNLGYEKYVDGSYYEGNFRNGQRCGRGKMYYKNGDSYDGEWLDGERNGQGVLRRGLGGEKSGEWKNDRMEGFGIIIDENGNRYEGGIKNDVKNGKGIQTYPNGDIYQGEYKQDQKTGYGEYYWKNGDTYKGQFVKGRREGSGELKIKNPKQKIYHGFFKNNMKDGYGVFYWHSGSIYKGFFVRDQREGYGQMFWFDGNVYRGEWKQGVQHGKGQLFIKNQGLMSGIFNNNKLVLLKQEIKMKRDEYIHQLNLQKNNSSRENVENKFGYEYKKTKNSRSSTISYSKQVIAKIKGSTTEQTNQELPPILRKYMIDKDVIHHKSISRTLQKIGEGGYTSREKTKRTARNELDVQNTRQRQKNLHSSFIPHKNFIYHSDNKSINQLNYKPTYWNYNRRKWDFKHLVKGEEKKIREKFKQDEN